MKIIAPITHIIKASFNIRKGVTDIAFRGNKIHGFDIFSIFDNWFPMMKNKTDREKTIR